MKGDASIYNNLSLIQEDYGWANCRDRVVKSNYRGVLLSLLDTANEVNRDSTADGPFQAVRAFLI